MRIACDLDDVCACLVEPTLDLYNKEYEDSVTIDNIHTWDMWKYLKPECGVKVYEYIDAVGFFSSLKIFPGCAETLKEIVDSGHEVIIVTATPKKSPTGFYEKSNWVRKNLPFIGFDNIISAKRKDLIRCDILLDDGPHNLEAFPGLTCAFSKPYNMSVKTDYRVNDWQEFRELFFNNLNHIDSNYR
jgi:5'-nucleotidase